MHDFQMHVDGSSVILEFEAHGAKQKVSVPDIHSCWRFPLKHSCKCEVTDRRGKPVFAEWKKGQHWGSCKLRHCEVQTGEALVLGKKCRRCAFWS